MLDSEFQFHNGSIKSLNNTEIDEDLARFQIHNGSIKRCHNRRQPTSRGMVSIPQWFD